MPGYQQDLAEARCLLAKVLIGLGEMDAAREEYETSLDLQKKLTEQYPAATAFRIDLGQTYHAAAQRSGRQCSRQQDAGETSRLVHAAHIGGHSDGF